MILFLSFSVVVNYLFWWSCFLILTLLFIYLAKIETLGVLRLSLFFLFQEVVGVIFLFNFRESFQRMVVLLKVGASPFHFWLYYLRYFLESYLMIWLFILYKFSILPLILYFLIDWFFFLILGLYVLYFQLQELSQFKLVFFFSSIESFGWLLIRLRCSLVNFVFFFLFYYILVCFILPRFSVFFFFNIEHVFFFLGCP